MKKTIITILALMLFVSFLKPICYAASITYENGDNSEAEGSSKAKSSNTVNSSKSESDGETIVLNLPIQVLENKETALILMTKSDDIWNYDAGKLKSGGGKLHEKNPNYIIVTKDKEDGSWEIKYLNKDINMTILIIGFVALALVAVVSILINALLIRRYRG